MPTACAREWPRCARRRRVPGFPSSSCTGIEYEGDGDPDYIVASDLPLQGSSRFQTEQINAAIRYVFQQANWKAGDYNIGFQACDDATAQAGKWDSGKCSQNANAYAANDKVIGVLEAQDPELRP